MQTENKKIIFDEIALKILDKNQIKMKIFLEEFLKTHFLVWWTAIALYLWHRKSIDFDLFKIWKQWTWKNIFERIEKLWLKIEKWSDLRYLSNEEEPEATIFIDWVKIQLLDFSRNPFWTKINLEAKNIISNWIKVPTLLDLSAMKLFAMMYRNKWKDAVDLYFLIKNWINFEKIIEKTDEIFTTLFQKEASFETIIEASWDKTEKVEYLIENPPKDLEIENFLKEKIKKLFLFKK